ncbi:MAG: efflux RND transporter periplasmic adaptor subunit [Proteobacteria bacterium]|nr:efflux RND transporter periplasmic adaptor subunit [Desulfobacteraceae bacterium]MBU3981864.1 efflux RND transporter periplasmic adaptor subunit [Pseudomonadota bacterium]MBU4012329.1 efflux RND transporter periplasmic adaptor subunit [Pseudomonadota bacterium]MBU4068790.1 efflux RND transporter periplasmic adaptor subunit [Pseudomonadota bacterium]MBU4100862.1 efflux RND transporter periplasmic adaptor subunit [Pseudomonadota bacterium]
MKSNINSESNISRTLGIDQSQNHRKHLKRWLIIALLAIVGGTSAVVWKMVEVSDSMQYQTQKVQRGNLTMTVTATGNLEPTNQVDVGTEVSGTVETVEVDYNDHVKIGQVLARLDISKLQAQVLKSKAALESARAKVLETQATVNETRNELARLKRVWELSDKKVPSQHDMDAAHAALQRALAAETIAKAQVSEAQATLESNETDLSKAVIHSPINGIVLTRSVEPGQTVAASLQSPVLFTLAEDLTKMELHVDVDEADVGQVKEGQEATFAVDAHPNRTFPALIAQVRYGSQTVNGVVTYKTVLNVDNSDLSLRPGMTATADITVKKVENAILLPNAALRFAPLIKEKEAASNGGLFSKLLPRRPRSSQEQRKNDIVDNKQHVWTLRDGQLIAIAVITGVTDGKMTEVINGDIEPGMELVVDTTRER